MKNESLQILEVAMKLREVFPCRAEVGFNGSTVTLVRNCLIPYS